MNGSRSRTGTVPGPVFASLRPSWAGRHRQSAGKSGGTVTRVGVTARTMRRRRPGSSRKGPQHLAGTGVVQRGESVMRIPSPASHGCLRSAGQHRRCRIRRNVPWLFRDPGIGTGGTEDADGSLPHRLGAPSPLLLPLQGPGMPSVGETTLKTLEETPNIFDSAGPRNEDPGPPARAEAFSGTNNGAATGCR